MAAILFSQARLFDGVASPPDELFDVLIEDGAISAVAPTGQIGRVAETVACGGRLLMPGLIDAHVHVYFSSLNPAHLADRGAGYHAHYAARFLQQALHAGFTSVRDVGGGDVSLALALRDGLLDGPRLFYGGRLISQTGGHGDGRGGERDGYEGCACHGMAHNDMFAVVADGVDSVRAAVREELRRGASHIKLMGSGGVVSHADPLDRAQYSEAEIAVAVEEAERWGVYVAAHCHPAQAIRRCADLGVRSIEHGTLIDRDTANFVAARGAFVVPTLSTIFALLDDGPKMGLTPVSYDKLKRVGERAIESMCILQDANVRTGFGTDLLGAHYVRRANEFALRARALSPLEILQSATSVNAALLRQEGKLGCIASGGYADLLVVDDDPLADIEAMGRPENLVVIMRDGHFVRRSI